MSYDITLMPRQPGQDWDEALEASNDVEVEDRTELLRTWARIEERVRGVLTGEVESYAGEPDSDDLTVGELSAMDSGIQVELYPGQAAVSFPYWEQADPQAFHRQVAEAVRIVAEETGYAAYDPQTDAEFDGTFDDGPGLAFTQQLRDDRSGQLGGGPGSGTGAETGNGTGDRPGSGTGGETGSRTSGETGTVTTSPQLETYLEGASAQQPRPFYSGRRRAGTYLVIGVVVTAVALWLLASGTGGTMSWVALAIGIADLVVGAIAWRSSREADPGR